MKHTGKAFFEHSSYWGRMILMGVTPSGNVALATAISGRSAGSQNRIYVEKREGEVVTEVFDPRLETGDPELTLYPAHLESLRTFAVSNGRQTQATTDCFEKFLGGELFEFEHEPDHPIYTSRITGRCQLHVRPIGMIKPEFDFCTHRKVAMGTQIEITKPISLQDGQGLFLCTYEEDGDPPVPFTGGPQAIEIGENPFEELHTLLSSYNDFLVGLAVKTVDMKKYKSTVQIWNKHQK